MAAEITVKIDNFDLFNDAPPIARRSDPASSKMAAASKTATTRRSDGLLMLDLIRRHPGRTSGEYSHLLLASGYSPLKAFQMPTKRISDLKALNMLRVGEIRKCTHSGRAAQTYFVKGSRK